MLATVAISSGLAACSDNYDSKLEPTKKDTGLKVSPLTYQDSYQEERNGGKFTLGAGATTIEIKVECNTRWAAKAVSDGGWCAIDITNGEKDGSFSISVRENRNEERSGSVIIYKVIKVDGEEVTEEEGSQTIEIIQQASNVFLTPSSVAPFAPDYTDQQTFRIEAKEISWRLSLSYELERDGQFIIIEPVDNMTKTDSEEIVYTGYGDASFNMRLLPNRTQTDRIGYIRLSSDIGEYSVLIKQLQSEYAFDVTPSEVQYVPAEGGTGILDFEVLSLTAWEISDVPAWITLSSKEGVEYPGRVKVTGDVAPNTTGRERKGTISFSPKENNYAQIDITVVQQGYDLSFDADKESLGIFESGEQTTTIKLNSRFNWEINLPDWISSPTMSGNASDNDQIITLNIAQNTSNDNRHGSVVITPKRTEFEGGVPINPENVGISAITIPVTQFGGKKPAISTPWLNDEYSQTSTVVNFTYYSPYYEVTGVGIQWKEKSADEAAWKTIAAELPADGKNSGTVSVKIENLEGGTDYVVRGYVEYNDGNATQRKYSPEPFHFTTPGKKPDVDDNPIPET